MLKRTKIPAESSRLARALTLALILSAGSVSAQQSRPPQRSLLERRILSIVREEEVRRAHWGVEVVSLRTGKRLVAVNSEKQFTPASTAKLFTVAAALSRLGPDLTYRTTVETAATVSADGRVPGDIVLVGRGDPNLSGRTLPYNGNTERARAPTLALEELAEQVARRGVRVVEGDLIVDDTYFVFEPYGQGWTLDDLQWWYGAPVSALALNDNVLYLHVEPGARAGEPARIHLEPSASHFQLDNRIVTAAPRPEEVEGRASVRNLTVERQPGSSVVRLWGRIPEGSAEWIEALAMDNPALIAGENFLAALARRGIELRGSVRVRELHPGDVADLRAGVARPAAPAATVLAVRQSLPLPDSLKVMLKVSQNLHAEMLLRTLGRERRQVGSVEAGLEEVTAFLKEVGVNENEVLLQDGSGLSRQSLVTPEAMVALLRYMYESDRRDLWLDLLPVAGTDGTLRDRLKGREVASRVRAKSGRLAGVTALAGYAWNRQNEPLAFAIFANHHSATAARSTVLIDRIVQAIAASR